MSWSEVGAPEHRRRSALRLGSGGVLAALAALAALAGCGFELRQPLQLHFSSIALTGFAARSPLAGELRRTLGAQTRVLDDPARAEVVLEALADRRERSVVASTAAAQVRELTLRLAFDFRVHTPGGRELVPKVSLLLSRDLSYSETFALAKEEEQDALFREMQTDIVAQVMRRLAAIHP
ncbi:MAG TPA: LPS assembly lipoprotein LptE [Rubrivivax sp.]|nr:hypothetical protein [Pseudomonadota bacterium]HOL37788.1 LPS assembly lipoprotein LptE [Rubrivivax sp.]HPP83239.1 LPS assembly lipoprotein LptE [Rubrivivax sp.]